MVTTPQEPLPEPDVVPSGDPDVNPVEPGKTPEPPMPETEPAGGLGAS
ncbi:hypothetical protein KDN32_21795 [Nocardioides sp. J2M5]|nr:hypothetical protein [Nocardioides palaemonis]MBS2940379.1 hypothetical protein [Nocardioides palaemonis]